MSYEMVSVQKCYSMLVIYKGSSEMACIMLIIFFVWAYNSMKINNNSVIKIDACTSKDLMMRSGFGLEVLKHSCDLQR